MHHKQFNIFYPNSLLFSNFIILLGIADQLQSNYAAEMRAILHNLYSIHSSSNDDTETESVEEALEAREDSEGESSGPSSTTGSPPETLDVNLRSQLVGNSGPSTESNYMLSVNRDVIPANEQHNTQLLIPPAWVADEFGPVCFACSTQFTLLRRRHHCRNCGNIFCNACASNYVPLIQYGYFKPVRVCKRCYPFVQAWA